MLWLVLLYFIGSVGGADVAVDSALVDSHTHSLTHGHGCVVETPEPPPGYVARHLVVVFLTCLQLAGLSFAYQRGVVSWEPVWVLVVEASNYFTLLVLPGAGDLVLVNGITIPWLRYMGWLAT